MLVCPTVALTLLNTKVFMDVMGCFVTCVICSALLYGLSPTSVTVGAQLPGGTAAGGVADKWKEAGDVAVMDVGPSRKLF